jgi:hypothetical protein
VVLKWYYLILLLFWKFRWLCVGCVDCRKTDENEGRSESRRFESWEDNDDVCRGHKIQKTIWLAVALRICLKEGWIQVHPVE